MRLFETVRLVRDVAEERLDLRAGEVGTVVELHRRGGEVVAFEVEFETPRGTRVVTLRPGDVQ